MKQNILILGSKSRAASRLDNHFLLQNDNFEFLAPDSQTLDITDSFQLKKFFTKFKPAYTINFAAKTDLTSTESERGNKRSSTWKINVEGVKNLVEYCNAENCHFVQISTSMVFSGSQTKRGPYTEDASPEEDYDLLCWYGITKMEAEKYIRKNSDLYTIIRLSNAARGKIGKKYDFLWRILKQYKENNLNPLFYDQRFTLTDLTELSPVLSKLVTKKISGILHVSDNEQTTPYEIAWHLIDVVGWDKDKIRKISIDEYLRDKSNSSLKLFYPKYWGLTSKITEKETGIKFKSWKKIIDDFIQKDNPINYL